MAEHFTEAEAIAAAQAEAEETGDWYDFDGQNCEDYGNDCGGWDGMSRRCACGNRRVQWLASSNSQGHWTAYASAY